MRSRIGRYLNTNDVEESMYTLISGGRVRQAFDTAMWFVCFDTPWSSKVMIYIN